MKRAKFEWWRNTKGQYYFRLRARNGEIICQSEGYHRKAGCMKGIRAVRWCALFAKTVGAE